MAKNKRKHSPKTILKTARSRTIEIGITDVNLRLAAIRRLTYEAADCGLLSLDLAAGIRRVKGVKKHGMRIENWLTAEQGKRLLAAFKDLVGKRGPRANRTRPSLGQSSSG